MANYQGDDFIVSIDNAAGTPVVCTQQVQTINGVDKEAVIEETHTFGDAYVEQGFAGLIRGGDITLGGLYDDTASTGSNALFNDVGCVATAGVTRTLLLTFGGTKTYSVEVIIKSYKRMMERGKITRYEVVLTPTGTITEA